MSQNPPLDPKQSSRPNVRPVAALATYSLTESDVYELAERGRLHAVLDAADAPDVLEFIVTDGVTAIELLSPDADPALGLMAPYLLPLDEELLARLRESAWRAGWGLLIEAGVPIEVVKRHLRRFLLVEHPAGRTVYFRMYDPRVLRRLLPSCSGWELAEIFGPLAAYIAVEGAGGERFTRFALAAETVEGTGGGVPSSMSSDDLAPRFVLRDVHLDAFVSL